MKYSISILLIILFFPLKNSFAQTADIRGFVYDRDKGDAITFCNVFLQGTAYGAATNIEGYYNITKVKPGNYTLVVTYLGYDTFSTEITLKANQLLNKNVYIRQGSLELGEINISDKRIEYTTEVKMSQIKITPTQISRLPTIGGTPDLAQYIQILPGVISSGDKGGQIFIRGGTPVQNKVIIDGMTIYNPFHSIGLFSVFDIDIIRNIDVYAGGYDAEYGDRISAVMDIKTIDGNNKRVAGKVGMSPFVSEILVHGPMKKWNAGEGHSNFLFSARNSFLDQSSKTLYKYIDSNGLPYAFNDYYAKLSFTSSDGSKFKFFGFNFNDMVDYENITQYEWNSTGIGTQVLLVPAATNTIIEGKFSFSNYRIDQREADALPRYSLVNGFETGLNFSYFLGEDLFKYGLELSGYKTEFQYYTNTDRSVNQTNYSTNLAAFFKYKKIINKLILNPSFRLQYYASLNEFALEPRIGAKYMFSESFRLKIAAGSYSQNFISAFSDRDVVNHFYGFLSSPLNVQDAFDGRTVLAKRQQAYHYISGFELDIQNHIQLNIEAYYKDFKQLTNINRNKIFDDTPEFNDQDELLRRDYILENGNAYGIDFHVTYDKSPFYFWLVYSLTYVNRYDGIQEYMPNWDRRHNIQILGTYTLGETNPFEISARWNFGSSFPFTQTQGFYEYLDFSGGITEDYTQTNGQLGIIYGDYNSGRLPVYHRLDLSLKKTYNYKNDRKLELVASVSNLYNRDNIFYFDRIKHKRVNQLPILPSIGVKYYF
jgi:hypothetical protein